MARPFPLSYRANIDFFFKNARQPRGASFHRSHALAERECSVTPSTEKVMHSDDNNWRVSERIFMVMRIGAATLASHELCL
jgi:hypothetical protein